MKIQDMILVIQNIKGNETNMLMTLKEYKEAYLFVSSLSREESAQALKELFDTKFSEPGSGWAERYITANKSYYAKFCSGSDELQCFLHGSYNDDKKFQFDREESSRECMWALEEYNLDVGGGVKAGNIGILLERGCHFIIKRNLRKESKEDWLRMAKDNSLDVTHPRDGGQEMLGKKTPP